ncbi:MAG: succinate dehydrogenase, cytochrome b556 subunit [Steroidobacteraceae bacterium]
MADTLKQRPVYRNIHLSQLMRYRLPLAGWASILHRISGALLFVLLPFIIWMFDNSVTSEVSYAGFASVFSTGWGALPGWFFKLVALALIWAYVMHFIGGLRHVWMDMTHAVDLKFGRQSALVTFVATAVLTLALGYKLFF